MSSKENEKIQLCSDEFLEAAVRITYIEFWGLAEYPGSGRGYGFGCGSGYGEGWGWGYGWGDGWEAGEDQMSYNY